MLDLVGIIAGNVLSLPGILGMAVGMMTRNIVVAAILGALVGVAETLIFVGFQFGRIEPLEFVVSVVVGVLAACVGCMVRRIGATA